MSRMIRGWFLDENFEKGLSLRLRFLLKSVPQGLKRLRKNREESPKVLKSVLQGLKPRCLFAFFGTTEVVPCYKTRPFSIDQTPPKATSETAAAPESAGCFATQSWRASLAFPLPSREALSLLPR